MDAADDDLGFEQAATLRDGRTVAIRLMRPDDKPRLVEAFSKLDRQSIYTRFFSYRKELPQGPLERIDRIDLVRLAALVVTLGEGGAQIVIGSASYVAQTADDGVREAEVAFTIEEDFQRQGLAGRLLAALAGIARRHGIRRFKAEVLAANAAMLGVFKRCGLPMQSRRNGEVVELTLDLGGVAGPA
jgi:RimJ/RimL family protein N-acetyltransferase